MSIAEDGPICREQMQISYDEIVLDPYIRALMESKILGHEVPGEGETIESLATSHIQEICDDRKVKNLPPEALITALEVCETSVKQEGIIRGEA